MQIRTNIWIEDEEGQVVFGLGRQRILQAIRETGSMKGAAGRLGLSYRGLWARLRHSERRLGFRLVDATPGGGGSAGTRLTPRAVALIGRYEKVTRRIYEVSEKAYARYLEPVLEIDAAD